MKVIVWGCDHKLYELSTVFPDLMDRIDVLLDENVRIFGNRIVWQPQRLTKYSDYKLVICVESDSQRREYYIEACEKYGAQENNIITVSDWISGELRSSKGLILRPTSVRLEACTLCQLNCPTCSMRLKNYGALGAGYLKAEDYIKFIEKNSFIKEIELSNYGEVFLNPVIEKILLYSYEKNIKLYILGGVNFNEIDDRIIDILAWTGVVKEMVIAIDGASQETYAVYRRNGDFRRVIKNIEKINQAKNKYGSEYPKLIWQYILFEHNEKDVSCAKDMAVQYGMSICFKLDWSGEYIPHDREKLEELTGFKYFNRIEYRQAIGEGYLEDGMCRQMIFMPAINYDGKLLGCCGVMDSFWKQNVFETGLLDALNSEKYINGILSLLENDNKPVTGTPCARCKTMNRHEGFHISL